MKSGYIWLLSKHYNEISQESLVWIWKLHLSAKLVCNFYYDKYSTSLSPLEVSCVIVEFFWRPVVLSVMKMKPFLIV